MASLGVEHTGRTRGSCSRVLCEMDRFFFTFWRHSCFISSRLYHWRTVRFAIACSFAPQWLFFLFSYSILKVLLTLNNSFPFSTFDSTTFNILQTFFRLHIYLSFRILFGHFFWLLFTTFVSFLWRMAWEWLGGASHKLWPGFYSSLGKVASQLSPHQPSCHRLL